MLTLSFLSYLTLWPNLWSGNVWIWNSSSRCVACDWATGSCFNLFLKKHLHKNNACSHFLIVYHSHTRSRRSRSCQYTATRSKSYGDWRRRSKTSTSALIITSERVETITKVRQRTLTDDIGLLEEAAHQTWKHEWTRKYPNQHWWTPQRYPFASETLQPPEGKRRSTKTTKTTKTTTHKHTHTWGNRLSKSRKACNAEATAAIRERSNFSNSAKTAGTSVS